MKGFSLTTQDGTCLRFDYYLALAPQTCRAFHALLPMKRIFIHARVSGLEIWTDKAHAIDCQQENSSVFVEPGEMVLGPIKPLRNKVGGALGIYYGEGKGLDAANVFAKITPESFNQLVQLGNQIWHNGEQMLLFEPI